MKKTIFIFILLFSSNLFFAQNDPKSQEKQDFYNNLLNTTKTLIINTSAISPVVLNDFKNELTNWQEKVTSITNDQTNQKIIIIHNGLLHPREMSDVLLKYGISNDKIISYY